ncbi:MAG: hypothetical protein M1838_000993 [Thelocarpon superellum]|nr:MAG: hypothetical protein M1838_000993 [Thelocarpon superellum]
MDLSGEGDSPSSESNKLVFPEDLVRSPTHKTSGIRSVDFDGLLTPPLRLAEDLRHGCGGQVWPAGMVLARYLLRVRREQLQEKNMFVWVTPSFEVAAMLTGFVADLDVRSVELGAGGGLVGLAVAQGCALRHPLYITDQQPMLDLMERNVRLNQLRGRAVPLIIDWGSLPLPADVEHPDIILAADCVYFEPAFPLLLETLVALAMDQTLIFFCFKKRRRADMKFIRAARKAFTIVEVDDDPDHDNYARENISLWVPFL